MHIHMSNIAHLFHTPVGLAFFGLAIAGFIAGPRLKGGLKLAVIAALIVLAGIAIMQTP